MLQVTLCTDSASDLARSSEQRAVFSLRKLF